MDLRRIVKHFEEVKKNLLHSRSWSNPSVMPTLRVNREESMNIWIDRFYFANGDNKHQSSM